MYSRRISLTAAALTLFAWTANAADPLPRAHAHNDYEHDRPLSDALDHGFTGFEADIWLVDGALLIAHDEEDLDPSRTLQGLYLDPLRGLAEANGGAIYPGADSPVTLLIDIKSDGPATYAALSDVLAGYDDILTTFEGENEKPGAVTAIVSGNRPREDMEAQQVRRAGYDGRMSDLDMQIPATFMPMLSDNWTKVFDWAGEGEMPADQRAHLDEIVATAHDKGWRIRFWATPDEAGPARDAVWTVLREADVDVINTDDLSGLQAFLQMK